jgi:ankyrin repeat protein
MQNAEFRIQTGRRLHSAFRILHRRDLYLRLEFAVGALVVIAFLLMSGFRAILDAAEPTLLDAAERGDRAAVTRMLSKGADPNTSGPDGTTAVMYAASNGDVELVRALIRAVRTSN